MGTLLKKCILSIVSISLVFILGGCSSSDASQIQRDFDLFLDKLPTQLVASNSIDVEYLFENPQDYGFEETLLDLPYTTLDDYKELNKTYQELLKTMSQFSYNDLTTEQQLTYDILKDYLSHNQVDEKFYYLDNNYFGTFNGFQVQLPIILKGYTFERENDLQSYFHILEQSPDVFARYVENEKERQKQGVGMSQNILNGVIQQCQNFAEDKDLFLIAEMNEKIDDVDFYNENQKQEAKEKNESLIKNSFLKAYEETAKALSQIKANEKIIGLATLPNGKEYYKYLFQKNTGIDQSIEETKDYLENKLENMLSKMKTISEEQPDLYEEFNNHHLDYGNMSTFEECLDYLTEQVRNDYPSIDQISYEIEVVPDSMKEHFSPAAYLVGRIDGYEDNVEQIWVNSSTYSDSLFSTIAHEGYPGHMYQNRYFAQLNLPTVRYLINYSGYSEGWATYVENNCYQYAAFNDEKKVLSELESLNIMATECIYALADIGVHYEGWTYDEFSQKMFSYYSNEDVLKGQYKTIAEAPVYYLKYYVNAMKYQDLYDMAKEKLGDQFRSREFHKVLLNTGPSSMAILEKQVNDYIQKNS